MNIEAAAQANHAAIANSAEAMSADRGEFIGFAIGDEQYGVDIIAVP